VEVPEFVCGDECTPIVPTVGTIIFGRNLSMGPCWWDFAGVGDEENDTAISVWLRCGASENQPGWSFVVHNGICGTIECLYEKPAGPCPAGTYSNTGHMNCAGLCPSELTVYACSGGTTTTTTLVP